MRLNQLTLQGVKDGKEVHEWQVNGAPCKKGEAPREAQENCYSCHTANIAQRAAVARVVGVLPFYSTHLHQHHNEHNDVEEKNGAEVGHHCHVEGDVIFQPAAV